MHQRTIGVCKICNDDMMTGKRLKRLACHPSHIFHDFCISVAIERFTDLGKTPLCPVCRAPIDLNKVEKLVINDEKELAEIKAAASKNVELEE